MKKYVKKIDTFIHFQNTYLFYQKWRSFFLSEPLSPYEKIR